MKEGILDLVKEFDEIKKIKEGGITLNYFRIREVNLRERITWELKKINEDEELRQLLLECPNQSTYEVLASIMMQVKGPLRTLEIEKNILTVARVLSGNW
jgi:hypothetical protein